MNIWDAGDISFPPSLQHEIEGMSFSETAVYFKEYFHLPDSLKTEIQAEWVAMARDKYANEVEMKPGALSSSNILKSRGSGQGLPQAITRSFWRQC